MPIVLKADGLALGKGVLICNTLEEAREGVQSIMMDKKFGTAGNKMVIEEFMTWPRSIRVKLCGWKEYQDHDFFPGSQARHGWRPGTQYRRYGNIFSESVLYG